MPSSLNHFDFNDPEPERPVVDEAPVQDTPTPKENPEPNEIPNKSTPMFPIDFVEPANEVHAVFHGGPRKRSGLKLAMWTWVSASIDGLVLFSLSCFFMVFFSILMKTSAKSFLGLVLNNKSGIETFVILFIITSWSYLIFSRVFMGASIGERSCNLRLGQPVQRFQSNYILKVIVRSTLVVLTGVFVLPILSAFYRRDLAGELSGIKIYSLQ